MPYIVQRVEGFFSGSIRDRGKPGISGETNKESERFAERDAPAVSAAAERGKAPLQRRERVEGRRGKAVDMGVSGGAICGMYHTGQPGGGGAGRNTGHGIEGDNHQ